MIINKEKLKLYVKKLYSGEKELINKQKKGSSFDLFVEKAGKPEREAIRSSQRQEVEEKYNFKCDICGLPKEKYKHAIHHIDGNSSNTDSEYNLVYLCKDCHTKVHRKVKAKLMNDKIRAGGTKNKKMTFDEFLLGGSPKKKKSKNPYDQMIKDMMG